MRMRDFHLPIPFSLVLALSLSASPGSAANAIVRDGDTIQIGEAIYRLDGIDAPELDQICIDDHADPWTCGLEARERLNKLIGGREVRCDDLGPDPAYKKRRIGLCTVEGESSSLDQQLVRDGFAVSSRSLGKAEFRDDEAKAREDGRGLWKGCFANPSDFRVGKKDTRLLGRACRADRDLEIRAVLFPSELAMPPACSIKGKFAARARVTGNLGIYQLQGCRSYAGLTRPDRWFCSEEDARAAGFCRAFNCRPGRGQ